MLINKKTGAGFIFFNYHNRFIVWRDSYIIKLMEKLIISSVEPQKKNKRRFNIYVDGEYCASLGEEACARFSIKDGALLYADALKEAVAQDNERYAFDLGADMLSYSMRTRREVENRLRDKGVDKDAAEAAINKLISYGYINDEEYASRYVQSAMSSGKSRRAAEYGLLEKGVKRETASEAIKVYTYEAEREIAKKAMESMNKNKDKKKIASSLARRGFDFCIITSLLSEGNFED